MWRPGLRAFAPTGAIPSSSLHVLFATDDTSPGLTTHCVLHWVSRFTAPEKALNSGIVEGLNYEIKLTIRKAYGYREPKVAEIAIYHALGKLPEPELTHRFC